MTKEEFIEGYCRRSGVTWESLKQWCHAVRCDCGEAGCDGWAMVPLDFETYNGLPAV